MIPNIIEGSTTRRVIAAPIQMRPFLRSRGPLPPSEAGLVIGLYGITIDSSFEFLEGVYDGGGPATVVDTDSL
jgi:hypothetical protein